MTKLAGSDSIALVDLDGTVADYDGAMRKYQRRLQAPGEPPYMGRYAGEEEPPHIEARRKLIQSRPGFWRNLKPITHGFRVVGMMQDLGFSLYVLTKGPMGTPGAWSEKCEWCAQYMPGSIVTITGDKSVVYGRVLYDDFSPYFLPWLQKRPRGLVVCNAHPWNESFKPGGADEHPNVFRYHGSDDDEALRARLLRAYARAPGEPLDAFAGA